MSAWTFISSGGKQGGNYLEWRSREKKSLLFCFVANFIFANMKAWLATAGSGDSKKIRPPAAAREEDVCQQATSAASCYFTDLWRLNEHRKRGAPSKEFAERERARSALRLVAAYMASYDVSTNPMAADGEKMKSVQNRRRTQVEERWHSTAIYIYIYIYIYICIYIYMYI